MTDALTFFGKKSFSEQHNGNDVFPILYDGPEESFLAAFREAYRTVARSPQRNFVRRRGEALVSLLITCHPVYNYTWKSPKETCPCEDVQAFLSFERGQDAVLALETQVFVKTKPDALDEALETLKAQGPRDFEDLDVYALVDVGAGTWRFYKLLATLSHYELDDVQEVEPFTFYNEGDVFRYFGLETRTSFFWLDHALVAFASENLPPEEILRLFPQAEDIKFILFCAVLGNAVEWTTYEVVKPFHWWGTSPKPCRLVARESSPLLDSWDHINRHIQRIRQTG